MNNKCDPVGKPLLLPGRPGYDQQSILRAAIEVFTQYGYDAASMGDVADVLGISRSALYHHVPAKAELLRLAIDEALVSLEEIPTHPEANIGPAYDRLRFTVQQMIRVFVSQLPAVTLLLRIRGNSDIERAALDRRRVFESGIVELVSNACDEGSIRSDIEPRTATRLLIGIITSATDSHGSDNRTSAGQVTDEMLSLIFFGLNGTN